MENNKVNELLTIDKIKEILEWIYENINFLQIEPFVKDRINDILDGKRVEPNLIGYGIFIEDTNGNSFDAVKYTYDLRSNFFARCLPILKYKIRKINAKSLKEAHQYVKINFIDLKEKGLNHKIINKDFQLFMSKKIVEFYEEEFKSTNGVFYKKFKEELEELKRISNIASEFNTNFIKNFCTENKVGSRIGNIFYAIANTHLELGLWTIYCAKSIIVDNTQYEGIVKESRTLYEKTYGIRPRINGFYSYLLNNVNKVDNLFDTNYLEKHLADYVMKKKVKTLSYADEAQDKQQTLIDITPLQTLSLVNQEILDNVGDMQITEPLKLRSKTGTFTLGYGNDWQEEETCMAFHFFLKNINKPLNIKQIQANLFPRYSEFVIIRLLDDLVERLEIEYTKEKIDNEDVYKIEPLEMFLWKTTDTHFLSKKLRREIIDLFPN